MASQRLAPRRERSRARPGGPSYERQGAVRRHRGHHRRRAHAKARCDRDDQRVSGVQRDLCDRLIRLEAALDASLRSWTNLDVSIVEVRIVEVAAMKAAPILGK